MAHDHKACAAERFDAIEHGSFHLYTVHAGLDEPPSILDGLFIRDLIGEVGHIPNEECALCPPSDRFRVADHIIHGDRDGCFVAEGGHPEGITHKDRIHASLISELCLPDVVGGHQHRFDLLALLGPQRQDIRFLHVCRHDILLFYLFRSGPATPEVLALSFRVIPSGNTKSLERNILGDESNVEVRFGLSESYLSPRLFGAGISTFSAGCGRLLRCQRACSLHLSG